ncbi:MAG: hypothetical protein R3A10_06240 [Caldilineaceae bacterium]
MAAFLKARHFGRQRDLFQRHEAVAADADGFALDFGLQAVAHFVAGLVDGGQVDLRILGVGQDGACDGVRLPMFAAAA